MRCLFDVLWQSNGHCTASAASAASAIRDEYRAMQGGNGCMYLWQSRMTIKPVRIVAKKYALLNFSGSQVKA
jgi:hypothetical protein